MLVFLIPLFCYIHTTDAYLNNSLEYIAFGVGAGDIILGSKFITAWCVYFYLSFYINFIKMVYYCRKTFRHCVFVIEYFDIYVNIQTRIIIKLIEICISTHNTL